VSRYSMIAAAGGAMAALFLASCQSAPSAGNASWGRPESVVNRVDEWYLPARFGMFYHWGMFTGGDGASFTGSKKPPRFRTVEAFEKAAPPPEVLAKNLVGLTKRVGAKYLILTIEHSCGQHMVIFPTKVPEFLYKTKRDYFGAVLREAHANGIKVVGYFSARPHHYKSFGKIYIAGIEGDPNSKESVAKFSEILTRLFADMRERYGKDSIDGFWMDGFSSWEPVIKSFPNAVRIGNNHLTFQSMPPPSDICAKEFTSGPCDPAYCRPSGMVKPLLRWGDDHLAPRKDYMEDIPHCGGWWYHGHPIDNQYTKDKTFAVKEMVCSLGVRRKWNFALGIGPTLDGTPPKSLEPVMDTLAAFMKWAAPAIHGTIGGEGAPIQGGWLNSGAYGVVTVPRGEENTYYLIVTEPPTKYTKNYLRVQHDWVKVKSITDLRTGKPVGFDMKGSLNIHNGDWSDIKNYGAKIFKIVIE